MKLHWYGHSCFLLTNRQGSRLLLDPFNDKVGYPMPMFAADVVLTSHGHFDHANVDAVEGPFTRYAEPGRYEDHGFVITGFPPFMIIKRERSGGRIRPFWWRQTAAGYFTWAI